jgi:hypothetical protein
MCGRYEHVRQSFTKLCETIWRLSTRQQAMDLASFLFKNDADPNGLSGGSPTRRHLANAWWTASLELIELLIQQGARVPQSGAIRMAVTEGHLDVLDLLLRNGGGTNERRSLTMGEGKSPFMAEMQQRSTESPLHIQ